MVDTYDSTNNRVVRTYRDNGNSAYGTAIVTQAEPRLLGNSSRLREWHKRNGHCC